jgi:hypothetical protein
LKKNWFWRFSVPTSKGKKKVKITKFAYLGFHFVAKNLKKEDDFLNFISGL